jgi:hypothetical protein
MTVKFNVPCCESLDLLYYKLMRADEFIPWKSSGYKQAIAEHIKICPVCAKINKEATHAH